MRQAKSKHKRVKRYLPPCSSSVISPTVWRRRSLPIPQTQLAWCCRILRAAILVRFCLKPNKARRKLGKNCWL
ncbi:Uncharacterised protein [Vibrio cholerae]|nr:Uncharacterised protein [Vibrio cholerae]